jgi:hypothetical protein
MTLKSRRDHDGHEQIHDAITAEEITGAATPNQPKPAVAPSSQKRPNACTPPLQLEASTPANKP